MHAYKKIDSRDLFIFSWGWNREQIPQLLQLHNLPDSHSKSGFVKFENSIFSHTVIPQNFKMIL